MKIIIVLLIFYKKLIIPASIIAVLSGYSYGYIAILMRADKGESIPLFSTGSAAVSYLIFSLVFQYFVYERKNVNEYYFYYNLGLNKYSLWISNLIISIIIVVLILII
ncbi:MAG: hypothetical protein COB81_04770 [Flavobacteriaceae bacterium]|nr:MAG: hypothetical protein COB81_04770 [Flavobacteriaceae bacterium]